MDAIVLSKETARRLLSLNLLLCTDFKREDDYVKDVCLYTHAYKKYCKSLSMLFVAIIGMNALFSV